MLHDALQAKPGLEKGSLWSRGINRFQEMSQTADAGSRGSSELLPSRPLWQGWVSQGPTELALGHRCPPGHCHCHLRLCRGLFCAVADLGGSGAGGFGDSRHEGFVWLPAHVPGQGAALRCLPFPSTATPSPVSFSVSSQTAQISAARFHQSSAAAILSPSLRYLCSQKAQEHRKF